MAIVFAFCPDSLNRPLTFTANCNNTKFISSILSKSVGSVVEFPIPFKSSFVAFTFESSIPFAYSHKIFPCFFKCDSTILTGVFAN